MKYRFEVTRQDTAHDGFFRLERYRVRHELFEGGWSRVLTRELFERGQAAGVLPYDPIRDEVVLIEQFRIGALETPGGPWLLEIVAGILEEGETPEAVVRREAMEEAGCALASLMPITQFAADPGGSSARIHLYCGRVDAGRAGGIHGLPEEGEDIRVMVVSFEDAMALIQSGRIDSAIPIIALQWLALNHDRVREQWLDDCSTEA